LQECDSNLIEKYREARTAEGKPKEDVDCLCRAVIQFSNILEAQGKSLREAEARDVEAWLTFLSSEGRCDRTRSSRLSRVHVFYQWLIRTKRADFDPTVFSSVPVTCHDEPRAVSEAAMAEFLDRARAKAEGPGASILDKRDWALFEFLYACGARATESSKVEGNDLSLEECDVLLHGKRSKDRLTPFTEAARTALALYLKDARPQLQKRKKGPPDQAVFLSSRGNRLSRQWIWKIVKRADPDFYVHLFRHCYGQHRADHGERIENIQEDLGHSSLRSTVKYTPRVSFEQLQTEHRLFHPRGVDRAKRDGQLASNMVPLGGAQTSVPLSCEDTP
jgi:integrase/recombinase XerD